MKLNNPLALLSLQLLGVGIEVEYETFQASPKKMIILRVNAAAWTYERSWQR